MRHLVESLESRLLLSVLANTSTDSAAPVLVRQSETEPNDSIDLANPIRLIERVHCLVAPNESGAVCLDADLSANAPPTVETGSIVGNLLGSRETADNADVDFFRFAGSAGDSFHIRLRQRDGTHASLALLDANGTPLSEAIPAIGQPAVVEYSVAESGDYFVRVGRRAAHAALTTGEAAYVVNLEVKSPPLDRFAEVEPNDTIEFANRMQPVFDRWHCDASAACPRPAESDRFAMTANLENGSDSAGTRLGAAQRVPQPALNLGIIGLVGSLPPNVIGSLMGIVGSLPPDQIGSLIQLATSLPSEALSKLADLVGQVPAEDLGRAVELIASIPADQLGAAVEFVASIPPESITDLVALIESVSAGTFDATAIPPGLLPPIDPSEIVNLIPPDLIDAAGEFIGIDLSTGIIHPIDELTHVEAPLLFKDGVHYHAHGSVAGDDVDYFTFTAAPNSVVVVEYSGTAPALLDGSGNALEVSATQCSDAATDCGRIEYFSRDHGDLFVRVGPASDAIESTYQLDVVVRREPHVEHEPNDSIDTANQIEFQDRYGWNCDWLCPLTGSTGPAESSMRFAPSLPDFDGRLRGFITGVVASASDFEDADYFRIDVPASKQIHLSLGGPLAVGAGQVALLDSGGLELQNGLVGNYSIHLNWPAPDGGVFYVRVSQSAVELEPIGDDVNRCRVTDPALGEHMIDCSSEPTARYELNVELSRYVNPVQGPDELEPNQTVETASRLPLEPVPVFAPGLSLRAGSAHGIAGGPNNDSDVFRFVVRAGERVNVGIESAVFVGGGRIYRSVDEYLGREGLNEFGDPIETAYIGGTPLFDQATGQSHERLDYIVANHPELSLQTVQLVVLGGSGVELGRVQSDQDDTVAFEATEDATYFARVAVVAGDANTIDLVHYRVGVFAQSAETPEDEVPPTPDDPDDTPEEPNGEPVDGDSPMIVSLEPGEAYRYWDSDGDSVRVVFRGRMGHATVHFTGGAANGSDIRQIDVSGVNGRGRLVVRSAGEAEVGRVEIQGERRFGRVVVDGNLGSLSSNVDLRAIDVDGLLGTVDAAGREITRMHAGVFDSGFATVHAIRELDVQHDVVDAVFERYRPWDGSDVESEEPSPFTER